MLFLLACTASDTAKDSQPVDTHDTAETGETGETGDTGDTVDTVDTTDTTDTSDTSDTSDTGDTGTLGFSDYVYTTDLLLGNTTCLGAAAPEPDPHCVETQVVQGTVVDFQLGDVEEDIDITLTTDEVFATTTSDAAGAFSIDLPTCTPLQGRLGSEDAAYVTTNLGAVVVAWGHIGVSTTSLPIVAQSTLNVVAILLGHTPEAENGAVIGRVYDCAGGEVENAQIWLHDAADLAPPDVALGYTDSAGAITPAAIQTSGDGLWVALDVPPGDWTAEAWGWDGAALVLLGSAPVRVDGAAATIVDVVSGRPDGALYPDICFVDCSQID